MTNEQALEILKNARPSDIEMLQAFLSAAISLEKQIPRKPIMRVIPTISENAVKVCPICKEILGYEYNYCDNCGQRIDWSEEE